MWILPLIIFDKIGTIDNSNTDNLQRKYPSEYLYKIEKMIDDAQSTTPSEVPDPYYDENAGFQLVIDLWEDT